MVWFSLMFAAACWAAEFPGEHWNPALPPAQSGWSATNLAAAHQYAQSIGSAALFVVHQGRVVDDWGETSKRYNVHSIRKSFLSALVGLGVEAGKINLSQTLAELNIDDNEPKLTPVEKKATVGDLLKARSGIYHAALYETESMKARRPLRGSHAPGAFWYYNNWDFNALGTLYEHAMGASIFAAFQRSLAAPLQMEDFRLEDTEYVRGDDSIHPAYPFRMTARDMARFGLLFARNGEWRGQQVLPAKWVAESTRTWSAAASSNNVPRTGYGYLWWTDYEGQHFDNVVLPAGAYSARGAGGHFILVVPTLDLVIVHRVDTDKKNGPKVEAGQFGKLVSLLLQAMPDPPANNPGPTPETLNQLVPKLMAKYHVPGVAIARIEDHRVAWEAYFGVRKADAPGRVDARTVFEAASMSKPPTAYAALKLVEQGKLALDRPLDEYLGKPYLPDDPRGGRITARMVLSHCSGLPNWRPGGWEKGRPPSLSFDPGARYQYSGEGFLYLQRALEQITHTPLDAYLKRTLLDPLRMTNSSYVWLDAYAAQAATGHDSKGDVRPRSPYRRPNAAYSLYCTAADYAKFLLEMMAADRSAAHSLSTQSLAAMLTPATKAEGREVVARRGAAGGEAVYFGLGWAMHKTASGDRIHHSGANGVSFRSHCEFDRRTGKGIVIMTNSGGGQKLWQEIIALAGDL